MQHLPLDGSTSNATGQIDQRDRRRRCGPRPPAGGGRDPAAAPAATGRAASPPTPPAMIRRLGFNRAPPPELAGAIGPSAAGLDLGLRYTPAARTLASEASAAPRELERPDADAVETVGRTGLHRRRSRRATCSARARGRERPGLDHEPAPDPRGGRFRCRFGRSHPWRRRERPRRAPVRPSSGGSARPAPGPRCCGHYDRRGSAGTGSLSLSTFTSDIGVSIRSGARWPERSGARSGSCGLTRRTRTGVLGKSHRAGRSRRATVRPRSEPFIGPRRSSRTRMVLPVVERGHFDVARQRQRVVRTGDRRLPPARSIAR